MRVGIKVLRNGVPVEGFALVPNLPLTTGFPFIPVVLQTNENDEWFGVVPLAIGAAMHMMDVVVDPEGSAVGISGTFDEVENQFFVDLNRRTVERRRLGTRIPGDGYFEVDTRLLQPTEVINVSRDRVKFVSNCATCQYFFPPGLATGCCVVNGLRTPAIPIPDSGLERERSKEHCRQEPPGRRFGEFEPPSPQQ